jgi:phosphatidylglycerophosphate synthase
MASEQAFGAVDRPLARGALVGIGAASLALAVAAPLAARALDLGPFYVAKVLAGFAIAALLVLANLPAHRPFTRFGPANHVTLARVAGVALLAGLAGEGSAPGIAAFACAVGAAAVLLDALDGRLARATGMTSAFGARFDMETDAALVMVLAVLAWQLDKAGAWVLASGLMRYSFVAAGRAWPWLLRPLEPSFRRKAAAAVQMGALVAVLAPGLATPGSALVAMAALALLCGSFAVDVLWLARHAKEEDR